MDLVPLALEIKTRALKAPSPLVCSISPPGMKDRRATLKAQATQEGAWGRE